MILDVENLYSNDQAITTTADSTNVIDLGVANRGPGNPLRIDILVTTTFAGGTSIAIDLETDDNESFSSLSTIASTSAIALASLVAGYRFPIQFVPDAMERYSRLEYTVAGTMNAGNITAGIVFEIQSSKSTFPSGSNP
jgi:hypothetical protein